MSETPQPDWALVRSRYEVTQDPAADICRDAGIDRRSFDARRKREGWRRQNPRPFPPPRSPAPTTAAVTATPPEPPAPPAPVMTAAPDPGSTSPAHRRRLLDRLVAAISMKLEQLERRMTTDLAALETGDPATATDHERETRAIGALIDNLGKITEIEADLERPAGSRHPAAIADLADEADRWRGELAERLSRIVEAHGTRA